MTAQTLRLPFIVAGLALLSACNVVMTKEPLFTQTDGAGAPNLRPGVWIFFKEADCKVDESKPFTEWPDCAGGGLVAPGNVVKGHKANAPADQLEDTPFVLAAGDPRIIQLQVDVDLSVQADASASGDATVSTSSSASHARPYGYGAVRPTKFDDQGRITAFTLWPIQCGPPPKDKDGDYTAAATLKPLPGLEMKSGDAVCTTRSVAALRNAAKASEAWAPPARGDSRWLRDAQR